MVKVCDLSGVALDYAVAMIELAQHPSILVPSEFAAMWSTDGWLHYSGEPEHESGDGTGAAGDAIIDREKIATEWCWSLDEPCWQARIHQHSPTRAHAEDGATRREAAMRCYAASKLGDDIDIPKEIANG